MWFQYKPDARWWHFNYNIADYCLYWERFSMFTLVNIFHLLYLPYKVIWKRVISHWSMMFWPTFCKWRFQMPFDDYNVLYFVSDFTEVCPSAWITYNQGVWCYRAASRFAPSQWETALLCDDASHWLGASLESALCYSVSLGHNDIYKFFIYIFKYVYRMINKE